MPCFLCKNINRGAVNIYADVAHYFCTLKNETKPYSYHCDKFDPEPIMQITATILNDFDFYRDKVELLKEYVNVHKTARYVICEVDDLQQGFDRVRREVEMLLASMRLWNYQATP